MTNERRVVLSLAAAQALFQTASVLIMTVGGLAGQLLAPNAALATAPIAFVALGTAIATIPASLLMARIGRRPGFVLGAMFGIAGGGVAILAIMGNNFSALCLGTSLVGAYQGFAQYYRFAASEASAPETRARAISLVLAGGVVAAVAGPHLGAITRDVVQTAPYAASFAVVLALSLAAALLLAATPLVTHDDEAETKSPARPLAEIVRQPRFFAALVGAGIGYGVMILVMTATPLSMRAHDHGVQSTAFVIQWHVLGMFVPSFFTGSLVSRFGLTPMMLTGVGLLLSHIAIASTGVDFLHFLSGLTLLGIGWNLLYVGGSTMLTETYRPSERAKVQALNDFVIVAIVAVSSFSAGALTDRFGWLGLNLAAIPLLAIAALTIVGAANSARRGAVTSPKEIAQEPAD